jgi:hypothetical protein
MAGLLPVSDFQRIDDVQYEERHLFRFISDNNAKKEKEHPRHLDE